MARSNLTEMHSFLEETEDLSDGTVLIYLNDAANRVLSFGVATTHARFAELQRLMTAHLLSVAGIAGKETQSESVSDVSITYKNNPTSLLFTTNWEREFHKVLTNVRGMSDICL